MKRVIIILVFVMIVIVSYGDTIYYSSNTGSDRNRAIFLKDILYDFGTGFGEYLGEGYEIIFKRVGSDYVSDSSMVIRIDYVGSMGERGRCSGSHITLGQVTHTLLYHELGHYFGLGHGYGRVNGVMNHYISGNKFYEIGYAIMYSNYLGILTRSNSYRNSKYYPLLSIYGGNSIFVKYNLYRPVVFRAYNSDNSVFISDDEYGGSSIYLGDGDIMEEQLLDKEDIERVNAYFRDK